MKQEIIKDVLDKLIGGIEPYGSTGIDHERLENIKKQTWLIFELVLEIKDVAIDNRDRVEYSMKEIGKHADKFLQSLVDELYEYGYTQSEFKVKGEKI